MSKKKLVCDVRHKEVKRRAREALGVVCVWVQELKEELEMCGVGVCVCGCRS